MKLNLKLDLTIACRAILREQLQKLNIPFTLCRAGEIEIYDEITQDDIDGLIIALQPYGITIIENQKKTLVERIKHTIDMMLNDESSKTIKVSSYLTNKLNYSYPHISNIFSESTFSSIENYIILRKVDFVKDLLCDTDLTLTEIAGRLSYSSVAHLSSQFKKTTGLTPSTFQRIMSRKKLQDLKFRKTDLKL
jgi:AraC-like DNA-binding protein